ncbi:pilus assembly protein [Archangium violaceum]|uniref:pilus assembly protein TadG-related protein n=1 Tax=Archangium violaceum TaxID=83451 RepID=UPI00193C64FC|nr:pilus assembly protein TadG-related protein [Archangium violaceum]QRK11811.1 pilus assembly protein [Archangium violaceum]
MRRRGQTLVVFALTLLLLVLMVTMTLSIGMKVKEKMELQTMADAAAYSNAVATARAFNSISLMNRALMGHMVAMTGVESLISWSGYYRGSLHAAKAAYDKAAEPYELIVDINCPPWNNASARLCRCGTRALRDIDEAKSKLDEEDRDLQGDWEGLDKDAGDEAKELQLSSIWNEQKAVYDQLTERVMEAGLARKIVDEARAGSRFSEELKAQKNDINQRELEGKRSCAGEGAACLRRDPGRKLHFVDAAMGSRGFSFVTGRGEGDPIKRKLQSLLPAPDRVTDVTNEGSGYFPAEGRKTHSANPIDATEVWGDDHGEVSVRFNRGQAPCPISSEGSSGAEAHVRSNHAGDSSDQHQWTGGSDDDAQIHTMGTCTQCPGMWPSHMDYNYNLVTRDTDNWGQPKNYAVIQRDYGERPDKRADPWNLFFRFRFSRGGEAVEFDNRGIKLSEANGGADISKATALSAGITYYKRAGPHWREPPNFLNPFWRATLVSAHVDQQGKDADVKAALDAAAPFTAEAYEALKKKGYEGW